MKTYALTTTILLLLLTSVPVQAATPIALECRVTETIAGPDEDTSNPRLQALLKAAKGTTLEIVVVDDKITIRRMGILWVDNETQGQGSPLAATWTLSPNKLRVSLSPPPARKDMNRDYITVDRFTGIFEDQQFYNYKKGPPYMILTGKCQVSDTKKF